MGALSLCVSPTVCILSCVLFDVWFVGGLYIWRLFGFSNSPRDRSDVILRRSISCGLACVVSAVTLLLLAKPANTATGRGVSFATLIGFGAGASWLSLLLLPVALASVLYIGLIVEATCDVLVGHPSWLEGWLKAGKQPFLPSARQSTMSLAVSFRNYIMAPFAEEFVFRACVIALFAAGGASSWQVVALSPLVFSLAHCHHYVQQHPQYGHTKALLNIAGQVLYTSVFGSAAAYVYVRTGHLVPAILLHALCNYLSIPDARWWSDPKHVHYCRRHFLVVCYGLGVVLFIVSLGPLTKGYPSMYSSYAEVHGC
ncbi:unnamed protein product [Vitrella brassicaformis CCMP3155]|uniref:intramembrane prenyl-peptidase Rce1 n=1 Tax=Vitrella brassicaformis (strain CCMP3155) TaxID=1169540 RepID=A0A0G4GQC6_VITBC|nr:unnamed protein product [Vitrella brassicaformis CCMP3155]|eukprot:CEM32651.1 unnamed protein product [Vitrella brassicaformis CCMP3155]